MAKVRKAAGEASVGKLARLPKDVKIHKRPLLRPTIPSPYTNADNQKVIYLGTKTPFMSALKRVHQLLNHIEKRATQSEVVQLQNRRYMRSYVKDEVTNEGNKEVVIVKATGKAIDKALGLALFLQEQSEYVIDIRTSSVATIDDIELNLMSNSGPPATFENETGNVKETELNQPHISSGLDADSHADVPESRIRYTSVVELHIRSR